MSKVVVYIASVLAIAGAAGGYYYVTRTEVIEVPTNPGPASPELPKPEMADKPAKPRPDHGDFKKRFEPTPPTPNGGRN